MSDYVTDETYDDRALLEVAKGAIKPTADAQDEQGNTPPLPTPHVEVHRWFNNGLKTWLAVSAEGFFWTWVDVGSRPGQWYDYFKHDDTEHEARHYLAAEVVALRLRVEELTRAVESGYREGHSTGRSSLQGGSIDGTTAANADWLDSDTRKALLTINAPPAPPAGTDDDQMFHEATTRG